MPRRKTIALANENIPGQVSSVDAEKNEAMRGALLKILPKRAPGLTQGDMTAAVQPQLPQDLWPAGAKSLWWVKTVQLDPEAKGLVLRDREAAQARWRRAGTTLGAAVAWAELSGALVSRMPPTGSPSPPSVSRGRVGARQRERNP